MSAKSLLKLFTFRDCPFCHRVEIAAAEKKLDIQVIPIPHDNIPDWYKQLNPMETVPLLQVDKKHMIESEHIVRYIDNISNPVGSLMGNTPYQRYRIDFFLSQMGDLISAARNFLRDPCDEEKRKWLGANVEYLDNIMKENQEKGGDYYCDDNFTIADIMLLPFLIRFNSVLSYYCAFDIFERGPHLKKMWAAGRDRASVKQSTLSPHEYIASHRHYLPENFHLTKAQGAPVLYGNKYCPFVDRVRLVCALRKVPFFNVEVDLSNKPLWYKYVNPRETVPVFVTEDGQYIHESLLIINYVDSTAPAATGNHNLLPRGNADKEYAVSSIDQITSELFSAFYNFIYNPADQEVKEWMISMIKKLQKQFDTKEFGDGPFLGGGAMNACDVAFLPLLVRMKAYTPELTGGYDAFAEFHFMETYLKACMMIKEVKSQFFTAEEYLKQGKEHLDRRRAQKTN